MSVTYVAIEFPGLLQMVHAIAVAMTIVLVQGEML
jgi:hypothetical protein